MACFGKISIQRDKYIKNEIIILSFVSRVKIPDLRGKDLIIYNEL
jgi:hypothetical protein